MNTTDKPLTTLNDITAILDCADASLHETSFEEANAIWIWSKKSLQNDIETVGVWFDADRDRLIVWYC